MSAKGVASKPAKQRNKSGGASAPPVLVIKRTFDAPRDLVWKSAAWWKVAGPHGLV